MDYSKIEEYAYRNGFDPDEMMNDFHFSSKKEQKALYNHIMQSGGYAQEGGNPQDQVSQIIQAYAQLAGTSPEEIMQQLQQLPQEQQQQALQEMVKALQQGQEQQMQEGGQPQGGGQEEQIMQLVQAYAEMTGQDSQQIMQQLQQMSPEEQQQALQQMAQKVQGAMQGQEQENPQEQQQEQGVEEIPMARNGIDHRSIMGYRDDSPYKNAPFNLIKSNDIDMSYTGQDLIGISDTGHKQFMPAYSGRYKFDGSKVLERPASLTYAQNGVNRYEEFTKRLNELKNQKNTFNTEEDRQKFLFHEKTLKAYDKQINDFLRKAEQPNISQIQKDYYIKEANKVIDVALANKPENLKRLIITDGLPHDGDTFTYEKDTPKPSSNSGSYKVPLTITVNGENGKKHKLKYDGNYVDGQAAYMEETPTGYTQWTLPKSAKSPYVQITVDKNGNPTTYRNQENILVDASTEKPIGTTTTTTPAKKTTSSTTPSGGGTNVTPAAGGDRARSTTPGGKNPSPQRKKSIFFPVKGNAQDWTNTWSKYLISKGLIPDKEYKLGELDDFVADYVQKNPDKYKDNPYAKRKDFNELIKDNKYGLVHESVMPPEEAKAKTDITDSGFQPGLENIDPEEILKTLPEQSSLFAPQSGPTVNLESKSIPYSPENESVLGRNPRNPRYSFKTGNLANSLINTAKISKAFQPVDLPYMQEVDARMAEPTYLDPRTGIQTINDQYNNITANINSNSTTGQAVLAGLSGKQSKDLESYMNDIQAKNQQIAYQANANRAELYNKLRAGKNEANANYYNTYQQDVAQRDANIDTALTAAQTLANDQTKLDNEYNKFLAFTPNVSDVSSPWDQFRGKKTIEYDKIAQDARLAEERTSNPFSTLTAEQLKALSPEQLAALYTQFNTKPKKSSSI